MEILRSLFVLQFKEFRTWFEEQLISKLLVIAGMVVILSGLSYSIYRISEIFFRSLTIYDGFGELTASYIIHASLVVIAWIAIGSVIVTTMGQLIARLPQFELIVVSSAPRWVLPMFVYIRSAVLTLSILTVLLGPIGLAVAFVFDGGVTAIQIIRIFIAFISLTVFATSIGGAVAYIISLSQLQKYWRLTLGITGVLFLLGIVFLVRLIFPSSMRLLISASPREFEMIFASLPLNSLPLPTAAMSSLLLGKLHGTMIASIAGLLVFSVGVMYSHMLMFERSLEHIEETNRKRGVRVDLTHALRSPIGSEQSLFYKDVLSVLRSPSDVSYVLLLLGTAVFFFLMLARIVTERTIPPEHTAVFSVFILGWIFFFSTAYFLRLSFPLMAREKLTRWHLFSAPIDFADIVGNKILLSIYLSLPLVMFVGLLWHIINVGQSGVWLGMISAWGIIVLSVLHAIVGSVYPNFSLGNDPDRVSTSLMGFLALFTSIGIATVTGWSVYQWLIGRWETIALVTILSAITGVIWMLYWLRSRRHIAYQL